MCEPADQPKAEQDDLFEDASYSMTGRHWENVVVFRGPVSHPTKNKIVIDRGLLGIQQKGDLEEFRIVCHPRGTTNFNDITESIIIPIECVGSGTRRFIRSRTDLKKAEVIFFLNSYIDTRYDGLERITVWMDRGDWGEFCDRFTHCHTRQLSSA
jgi:hypothetical protein